MDGEKLAAGKGFEEPASVGAEGICAVLSLWLELVGVGDLEPPIVLARIEMLISVRVLDKPPTYM